MFRIIITLIALSIFNFASAQTISTTFYKTCSINSNILVINDCGKYNFEIVETKGTRVIVETSIEANTNENVLNALVKANRYDNIFEVKDSTTDKSYLNIFIKENPVFIKGVQLEEKYKFKILVPETITVIKINNNSL